MLYNEDNRELRELAQQVEIFKRKIKEQVIINERLMRNVMKGKSNFINTMGRISLGAGIFALIYCPIVLHIIGFSQWLCVATFFMLAFSSYKTLEYYRDLWQTDILHESLIVAYEKYLLFKKRYKGWDRVMIPIILAWIALLMIDAHQNFEKEIAYSFTIGALIGVVIGGIIGLTIRYKTLRKTDELLAQIEEIKREESL